LPCWPPRCTSHQLCVSKMTRRDFAEEEAPTRFCLLTMCLLWICAGDAVNTAAAPGPPESERASRAGHRIGVAGARAREPRRLPRAGEPCSGHASRLERLIERERERRQREEDAFSHRQVGWIFSIAAAIVSYKSINSVFSIPRR
jgi:hypothetical protein